MTTSPVSDTASIEDVYIFPTSFTQQSLWFINQLAPHSATYNIPAAIRIATTLDVEALERSLNEIISRHEALRTTFKMREGQPVQVISPQLSIPLAKVDLRGLPSTEREAEAQRLATEEARRPFDLAHGPLIRFILLQLAEQDSILLVTMHHIISDGWSMSVFLKELVMLYEAFSNGQTSPLAELSIQYADFANWQRDWLQGETLEEQLAYWKGQLAAAPPTLALPLDHLRPHIPGYRGSMQPFTLSKELTNALKSLSLREGVTLYMTLVAAFQTLLHRYTQQDDILIGSPIAGRTQPETEDMIGAFINTVMLRTDLSGNPPFRKLLGRVREVVLDVHSHQDIPFEYLVKELQPERNPGQNPFFQVLLALEHSFSSLPEGWTLTNTDIDTGTSKFDLSLILDERPEGIVGRFEYSTDLFEATTIERMLGHWLTLLTGIIADPDQRVGELPLLREEERQQILVQWNATATPYPHDRCVHQLFEEQVGRTPDAIALVLDDQQMTYRELNRRANQFAHCLQRLGVGPEVLVGLCMDRSLEMVVAVLGILKAGGAYLPLDPAYPGERLTFMLKDSRAAILVTHSACMKLLPPQDIQIICLDSDWQAIEQERPENPVSGVTARNLAYVMYTSGSTGKPKGTEIEHRSINRLVFGVDYAHLNADQVILHMAPISFDASTFEIWGALLHGARCVLFPERFPTPKSIGSVIRKHQVTTVWLTASLFNAIIDEAPETLTATKQVLTGGEALSVAHIRRALELLPSTQLINGYGPHESTTFTCCYAIPQSLSETQRAIPIGRPIGNTQVYILDRYLNPMPMGAAGELHIGGAGLARGYLNRPELTNEKFIPSPFSKEPGARLYKTGDLAHYLPDGTIEFIGRLDLQVKIRGFRVELGEIEASLSQHSAVRETAVLACKNEQGEQYLVAYVVLHQEQAVLISELQSFLKEHIPTYMLPSAFVLLDALPLTPNGKLDTRALPAADTGRQSRTDSFVAPTLPLHHQLVQIWEDMLNVRPIGITDDFFSLGGHSLLAARMVDKIEQVCGKKIPLSSLFAGATIAHLTALLLKEDAEEAKQDDKKEAAPVRAKVVAVQAGGAKRPFFFLHGDWYGGGFYCMNLARGLDREQPFYVLEPYEFDRVQVPLTFEAMAAAHIEAMRTVQPEGPYLLGGFCNGGLLAYEIARQLHARGEKVDLLVLIDPATPYAHRTLRTLISRVGRAMHIQENIQLNWFLRYLYWKIPSYRIKVQESKNLRMPEQVELERKRKELREAGYMLPRFNVPGPTPEALRYQWSGIYRWVGAAYTPGPYAGKLTLFWSSQTFAKNVHWHKLSGTNEVEEHVFPGTHMSCKNENLHLVAEQLNACLMKAQEID